MFTLILISLLGQTYADPSLNPAILGQNYNQGYNYGYSTNAYNSYGNYGYNYGYNIDPSVRGQALCNYVLAVNYNNYWISVQSARARAAMYRQIQNSPEFRMRNYQKQQAEKMAFEARKAERANYYLAHKKRKEDKNAH